MSTALKHDAGTAPTSRVRRALGGTPRRLILLTAGLVVLGLLLGLVYALGLGRDASGFTDLDARTTEVSATSDLYYELNDMDAQAANALLVGYHPADPTLVPAAVDAAASDAVYEQDRAAADADLEQIADNPLLTAQVRKLLDGLGSYEALIAQALYVDEAAQHEQPAAPPAAALASYTQASALLHTSLLPISLQIADTDSAAVDGSYSGEHSAMMRYGFVILALALLAVLGLLLGNRYYARAFRRRISWLIPAVAVSLMLGFLGLGTQLTEAGHLHYAKQEAYDSINALERAKAVSDDANADESRWLLEGRSSGLQASFFQKIGEVATVPGVSGTDAAGDPDSYYSGLAAAVGALHLNTTADTVSDVKLGGDLGTELENLTFPGEAQAAFDATRAFDTYVQYDATIRSDADRGDLAAAVGFDIGTRPGQSNYAFNQYTSALGKVIQINDGAFTSGIAAGQGALGPATWAELVIGEVLFVLFVLQAGYLRLREYR